MTSNSKSDLLEDQTEAGASRGGLIKMGAIALASAFLGAFAATWWYGKTVRRLHETGEQGNNPHFGIGAGDRSEDSFEEL